MQYKKQTLLYSIIIVILLSAVIFLSFITTRYLLNKKTTRPQPRTTELKSAQVYKMESQLKDNMREVIKEYIATQYPRAKSTNIVNDFIGMGYGIATVSFSQNDIQQKRKIYLKFMDSDWKILYDSEKTITCDKVRELIDTENILTFYCEE